MASVDVLHRVGDLGASAFASPDEETAAVLDLVARATGLRTPLLARTEHGLFEVVAVDPGQGCPLPLGATLPLDDSY